MKKLFAVLMAIALVLSMGTTFAFAVEGDKAGTITIEGAITGSTYSAYKMLDFAPSNKDGSKGVYTIVAGWEDFFNAAPATDYFELVTNDDQTTVVLKTGVDAVDQDLAKAALDYAVDKSIVPAGTVDVDEDANNTTTTAQITDLDLGYYVIDTTVGTMGAITRASNELKAVEKNEMPDIDKEVQEDSDMNWGDVNDANIDQVVNYKSTIRVGDGAVNYIMHDTMETGLTFIPDSVSVEDKNGLVDPSNYEVIEGGIKGDGHTFDVKFNDDYIATLDKNDEITVFYSATLNHDATIGPDDSNDNEVYLTAGEKNEWETNKDKTATYTWLLDVLKYMKENEDADKTPLAGATFRLLDPSKVTDTNDEGVVYFLKVADTVITNEDDTTTNVPTYMVVAEGTAGAVTEITTNDTGKFYIVGLDDGKYQLDETNAPSGYNKLAAPVDITIGHDLDLGNYKASYTVNGETPATIEVENKTGGLFPETGGIGTVIFYLVGGLLMAAAVVFLVSKKRMDSFA